MDEETYNQLVERAKDEGYDVSKLHKTPHSDSPPEEEGPQDTKGVWWIKSLLGKQVWLKVKECFISLIKLMNRSNLDWISVFLHMLGCCVDRLRWCDILCKVWCSDCVCSQLFWYETNV